MAATVYGPLCVCDIRKAIFKGFWVLKHPRNYVIVFMFSLTRH